MVRYPVQTDPMDGFEDVTNGKVPKSRSITGMYNRGGTSIKFT